MQIDTEFDLDEIVYDDLTKREVKITGIQLSIGRCDNKNYHGLVFGYWLDDPYLGGGRFPWEIDHLPPRESQFKLLEPIEESEQMNLFKILLGDNLWSNKK